MNFDIVPPYTPAAKAVISQPAASTTKEVRYCPYCRKQGNLVKGSVARGTSFYCARHYRIQSSRNRSLARGLTTPTTSELEALIPTDLRCPLCKEVMHYKTDVGIEHKTIMSLQHWNDGTVEWICLGCNSAHGMSLISDKAYRELLLALSPNEKICRDCNTIQPLENFYVNANGSKGRGAYCKPCHVKRTTR